PPSPTKGRSVRPPSRPYHPRRMHASLIVRGGPILTLEPSQPRVRALAAFGEELLALGDESDLQPLIGPDTEVLDLAGRCAVPGLIAAHVHLLSFGPAL